MERLSINKLIDKIEDFYYDDNELQDYLFCELSKIVNRLEDMKKLTKNLNRNK